MSIEKVRAAFAAQGIADRIRELDESSATVALAAQALGCEPGRIAKTLSFQGKEQPMLTVAASPRNRLSAATAWVNVWAMA